MASSRSSRRRSRLTAGLALLLSLAAPASSLLSTPPAGARPAVVALGGSVPAMDLGRNLAVNPVTGDVYVLNTADGTLTAMDGATNATLATISVGVGAKDVVLNPATNTVYVSKGAATGIEVIDGATKLATTEITTTYPVDTMAVNPATNTVYLISLGMNAIEVIDGASGNVVGEAYAPCGANDVAVNPSTNRFYVSCRSSGELWAFDGATLSVGTKIKVKADPDNVAINSTTNTAYVVDSSEYRVTVVDLATEQVTATLPTWPSASPLLIAVNERDNLLYVDDFYSNSVRIYRGQDNTLASKLELDSPTREVAMNQATGLTYALSRTERSVSVLPTSLAVPAAKVAVAKPSTVAFDPALQRAYVVNWLTNDISVLDTVNYAVVGHLSAGSSPQGLLADPITHRLYVANSMANNVWVVDPSGTEPTVTIPVRSMPYRLALNPISGTLYVANFYGASISVIDTASIAVIDTIPVGSGPYDLAVDPARNRLYVGNYFEGTVSTIDTVSRQVQATVAVGTHPYALAVNSSTATAYVISADENKLSAIDEASGKVVAEIGTGSYPAGLALDESTNTAYVANGNDNTVSVIDLDANTTTATMATICQPFGAYLDPSRGTVYVPCALDSSVSVFNARQVPSAPSVTSTSAANASATLAWNAPSRASGPVTGYVVTAAPALGPTTSLALGPGARSATITGLRNGTDYRLSVRAINQAGAGEPSTLARLTPHPTPPGLPGIGVVAAGDRKVSFSWTAAPTGDSPILYYLVQVDGKDYYVGPGVLSQTIEGLTNGKSYQVSVTAVSAQGPGGTAIASGYAGYAPGTPGIPKVKGGLNGRVELSWKTPKDGGGFGPGAGLTYTVSKALAPRYRTWTTAEGCEAVTVARCTATNLLNGSSYHFRVVASNPVGGSPSSKSSKAATPSTTAPSAPTALVALAQDALVDLSWAVPADLGGLAVTYRVELASSPYRSWTKVAGCTALAVDVTRCSARSLRNGTSYRFRVVATNAKGSATSPLSAPVKPGVRCPGLRAHCVN